MRNSSTTNRSAQANHVRPSHGGIRALRIHAAESGALVIAGGWLPKTEVMLRIDGVPAELSLCPPQALDVPDARKRHPDPIDDPPGSLDPVRPHESRSSVTDQTDYHQPWGIHLV
jgi:hypothetical protein